MAHPDVTRTITLPRTLATPHHDGGHWLVPQDPAHLGYSDPNHPTMQVWSFLTLFKFRRTDEHEQGTTWIELFILFQMLGGDVSSTKSGRQNNRGIHKENTKCALADLKKVVRHVVSVCLVHAEQEFFKPSKLPIHRLALMKFYNFASCISAHPLSLTSRWGRMPLSHSTGINSHPLMALSVRKFVLLKNSASMLSLSEQK